MGTHVCMHGVISISAHRLVNETDRHHASYTLLTYMVLSSVVLQLMVCAVDYAGCICCKQVMHELQTSHTQALHKLVFHDELVIRCI